MILVIRHHMTTVPGMRLAERIVVEKSCHPVIVEWSGGVVLVVLLWSGRWRHSPVHMPILHLEITGIHRTRQTIVVVIRARLDVTIRRVDSLGE